MLSEQYLVLSEECPPSVERTGHASCRDQDDHECQRPMRTPHPCLGGGKDTNARSTVKSEVY